MDNRSSQDTGNYGLDYTIHLRTQGPETFTSILIPKR